MSAIAINWSQFAIALFLCSMLLLATTSFHYEALRWLAGRARSHRATRRSVPATLFLLVAVHIVDIGAYAVTYWAAAGPLAIGTFGGRRALSALDYFYYAAETYSSLGYGDIFPVGEIRLIASIGPLNGILLLAWSGSFLFALVQHTHPLSADE